MWISKKKWESLDKRIADLEVQFQGQQVKPDFLVSGPDELSHLKQAFREVLAETKSRDQSLTPQIMISGSINAEDFNRQIREHFQERISESPY